MIRFVVVEQLGVDVVAQKIEASLVLELCLGVDAIEMVLFNDPSPRSRELVVEVEENSFDVVEIGVYRIPEVLITNH